MYVVPSLESLQQYRKAGSGKLFNSVLWGEMMFTEEEIDKLEKLTKAELLHLLDTGVNDWEGLERNIKSQANDEFPCWECIGIGRKVGIKIETK